MKSQYKSLPPIQAVSMSLFPTMNSLNEVMALGESKLPITDFNDLYILIMTYHNTLIKELKND